MLSGHTLPGSKYKIMENKENNFAISALPTILNVPGNLSDTMMPTLSAIRQNATTVSSNINFLVQTVNGIGITATIVSGQISYIGKLITPLFENLKNAFRDSIFEVGTVLKDCIYEHAAFSGDTIAVGCSFLASTLRDIGIVLVDIISTTNKYEPEPSAMNTFRENFSTATSIGSFALTAVGAAAAASAVPPVAAAILAGSGLLIAGAGLVSAVESFCNLNQHEDKETQINETIETGKERLNALPVAPPAPAYPATPFTHTTNNGTVGQKPEEENRSLLRIPGEGAEPISEAGNGRSQVVSAIRKDNSTSLSEVQLSLLQSFDGLIERLASLKEAVLLFSETLADICKRILSFAEALKNAIPEIGKQATSSATPSAENNAGGGIVRLFTNMLDEIGRAFTVKGIADIIMKGAGGVVGTLYASGSASYSAIQSEAAAFIESDGDTYMSPINTATPYAMNTWYFNKLQYEQERKRLKGQSAVLPATTESLNPTFNNVPSIDPSISRPTPSIPLRINGEPPLLSPTKTFGIYPEGKQPDMKGRTEQNIILNIGKVFEKIEVNNDNFNHKLMEAGELFAKGIVKAAKDFQELQTI